MSLGNRLRARVFDAYLGEDAVRLRQRAHKLFGQPRLELYYQVDDPYSHLLAQTLGALVESAGLELDVLLVPPPAPDVDTEPDLRLEYALRDAQQLAADYELSFPADAGVPDRELVDRANAILAVSRPGRRQLELALRVGDAVWSHDARVLGELAAEGAVSPGSVLARHAELRRRRGHYQGSMLRYAGEWYWGVDRLRHLTEHLRREGRDVPDVLVPRARDVALAAASELEMFFSFRSPYSYIAAVRAIAMCDERSMPLRIRPVLPMVMRGHTVPLRKRLYIARDAAREARWFDVPFGRLCDPLGPGIERCMAIFYRARELGRERELVASVGRGAWAEARNVADDEDLRVLCERASVPWSDAREAIAQAKWRSETEENQEALYARGQWGVPTFVLGDFVVWGNDRLDMIERRL